MQSDLDKDVPRKVAAPVPKRRRRSPAKTMGDSVAGEINKMTSGWGRAADMGDEADQEFLSAIQDINKPAPPAMEVTDPVAYLSSCDGLSTQDLIDLVGFFSSAAPCFYQAALALPIEHNGTPARLAFIHQQYKQSQPVSPSTWGNAQLSFTQHSAPLLRHQVSFSAAFDPKFATRDNNSSTL